MRLQKITSRENRRLVHTRKVRDGKEPNLIFIEGRRLVAEAMRSNLKVTEGFVVEGFSDEKLIASLQVARVDIHEIPEPLFRSIAATREPQGIVLLAKRPSTSIDLRKVREAKTPILLFLKEVNNPSNVGAVLRSAEAAGAAGVLVSANSADIFSPKAIRASMGAAFRVPIRVNADLAEIIKESSDADLECLGVDISAEERYIDVDWMKPHLLIFGSEAHGLGVEDLKLVSRSISIPMEPNVESLNLAVAASVVLFEARRQMIG